MLSHSDVHRSTVSNDQQSCSTFATLYQEGGESLQVILFRRLVEQARCTQPTLRDVSAI